MWQWKFDFRFVAKEVEPLDICAVHKIHSPGRTQGDTGRTNNTETVTHFAAYSVHTVHHTCTWVCVWPRHTYVTKCGRFFLCIWLAGARHYVRLPIPSIICTEPSSYNCQCIQYEFACPAPTSLQNLGPPFFTVTAYGIIWAAISSCYQGIQDGVFDCPSPHLLAKSRKVKATLFSLRGIICDALSCCFYKPFFPPTCLLRAWCHLYSPEIL